jgi:hypothetical protein
MSKLPAFERNGYRPVVSGRRVSASRLAAECCGDSLNPGGKIDRRAKYVKTYLESGAWLEFPPTFVRNT